MKNLLIKEFTLALHPTSLLFTFLSAMLLIPSYPYFVVFFYCCLGIFFVTLSGRENKDIDYTMLLPVPKKDIVKARFLMVTILQTAQIIAAVPFMLLRARLMTAGNAAGLDANTALLGFGFIFFGLFNLVFFTKLYKNVNKVGASFFTGTVVTVLFMLIVETAVHAVPFVRDHIDSPDPENMEMKLILLVFGIVCYAGLTLSAYHRSVRSFEKLDL